MRNLLYLTGLLSVFVSLCCLAIFLSELTGSKRWKVISRLQNIKDTEDEPEGFDPLEQPFKERVITPLLQKMGRLMEKLTPEEVKKTIASKLIAGGYTGKSSFSNFLVAQGVLAILLPLIFILFSYTSTSSIIRAVFNGFLGLVSAALIPIVVLNQKKNMRQHQIRKSLPDTLDLLVISVEAGLSFDMALVKVVEKIKGTLSDELNAAIAEVRMGKIRRMALKEMADRTGVDELITFVSAVFQADQLGVSIGNVLRVQADAMRVARRQKIEEQSAKAPVKMLFPLVFCILPSLFVVIIGPALIQIMKIFSGMGK